MKILSGLTLPTDGAAYINGFNIVSQWSSARKCIGYCPQIDPIHDHLNAFEHLYMYGRLKGVPEFALKKMAKDLIIRTGLLPFAKEAFKDVLRRYEAKIKSCHSPRRIPRYSPSR